MINYDKNRLKRADNLPRGVKTNNRYTYFTIYLGYINKPIIILNFLIRSFYANRFYQNAKGIQNLTFKIIKI